uniref:Putative secreted peptide n=1 Tax=Anopheles braziliensis TaxID=58242 RepID=A0A2M3ZPZ9_9DIPT
MVVCTSPTCCCCLRLMFLIPFASLCCNNSYAASVGTVHRLLLIGNEMCYSFTQEKLDRPTKFLDCRFDFGGHLVPLNVQVEPMVNQRLRALHQLHLVIRSGGGGRSNRLSLRWLLLRRLRLWLRLRLRLLLLRLLTGDPGKFGLRG